MGLPHAASVGKDSGMGLLLGLIGKRGVPADERIAVEQYLQVADPFWQQLDGEYRQWIERIGVTRGTDMTTADDPRGEHSGVFVWRTIETERTFSQLQPPTPAGELHVSCVRCLQARHEAASMMYDALQISDVRSPRQALEQASQGLAEADKLHRQALQQRESLNKMLR